MLILGQLLIRERWALLVVLVEDTLRLCRQPDRGVLSFGGYHSLSALLLLKLLFELLLLAFFLGILLLKSVSQDLLSARVQATSHCRVLLEVERLCILHRCSVIAHHLAKDVFDIRISLPQALLVFEILHCSDLLKQLILASLWRLRFSLTRNLWHSVLGHILLHKLELLLRFDDRMDQLAVKL